MIAAVPLQIVGPRESVPLVSVVQDTLVGANRFTRPDVLFTRKEAMNLLVHAKRWNGKLPAPAVAEPQPMWSGQQLMSALLPPVSLKMKNSSEQMVSIFQGAIDKDSGAFDKAVFSKQLIHIIFNDYGPDMTVDFLDSLQAMIANFLMNRGFSVGISDLIADSKTNEEIQAVLGKITKTVEDQILQLHTGLFENSSGRTNQEEFEAKLMATLNKAYTEAGKIGLNSLSASNRMTNMVKAGSKGSDVNVSQMIATLGQIAIEGKRIPKGFQHRTLPHFKRFDDSAQARGFSASSFIKGLQPDEFFFHAMSGREGLIDTAVKTADTGYLQRKIRVALEDLVTQHDGSVRDAGGNLVQMAYGEDGANATKIEGQPLPIAEFSDEKLLTEYAAAGATDAAAYLDAARADRAMLVEKVYAGKPQRMVRYPVHLERLLFSIKAAFHLKDDAGTATAQEVLEAQKTILVKTHANNRLWGALVRYHLRPTFLAKHGFTKPALDALVQQAILNHWKAWVEPGQPVGIIAAQSIGEPATQMCSVYSTKIIIHGEETTYSGPIGAYIDGLLEKHKDKVIDIDVDSVVLNLNESDKIVGVSNDEKTSWLPIRQVSRHPANGGLVEIRTRTGRSTTATLTHSFLKRGPKGVESVLGSALKVGDRVPVALKIDEVANPYIWMKSGETTFDLDAEFGWVCGMYVADGCLNGNFIKITKINPKVEELLRPYATKIRAPFRVHHYSGAYGPAKDHFIKSKDLRDFLAEHFKTGSFEKRIPDFMFHAPVEFICGFLRGYFDGDGNVSVTRQHIRLSSRNETLLRDTNRLLAYAGLFGVLGEETSVRIPDAIQYTLHIPKAYAAQFKKTVGFLLPEKAAGLDEICAYMMRADKNTHPCELDKIPALGDVLAETGKLLAMPGQSRLYGRWAKKESIGRETLRSYLPRFNEALATVTDSVVLDKVMANLTVLEAAAYSDVLWDEIVELVYHDDPHTFVYDFTVPGNDSFMVDDNILVHNTLNTFHLSGVAAKSNMTRGVPRLNELLKATKKPKATELVIPLRRDLREKKEEARRLAQELEFTLLKDIVSIARIYYDPRDNATLIQEDADWLAYLAAFEAVEHAPAAVVQPADPLAGGAAATGGAAAEPTAVPAKSPFILRFELDRERMFAKDITMDDIAFVLKSKFPEVETLYTDYNASRLVFRIRLLQERAVSATSDDLNNLKALQNKILTSTAIRGVPGLRAVNYVKTTDTVEYRNGTYDKVEQYTLVSDGSNFTEVIAHPDVDATRVVSSDIYDMFNNLGIEATRAVLYKEISTLFAESGVSVNYRHISVLLDKMCHKGRVMSVDRYGINKNDVGPLAKMSFEQTEDMALRAALFGDRDPCLGISAKVMLGAPIRAGTAFTEILLDEIAAIKLAESTPATEIKGAAVGPGTFTEDELDEELYGAEEDTGLCGPAELRMKVPMPLAPIGEGGEETLEEELNIVLVD
jgi:DNA-directed RNA polymerase beta' subunit